MPHQIGNPTNEQIDTLLNTIGVNVVPLDIFSIPVDSIKPTVEQWDFLSLRMKPAALLTI
jgi:hypothetical protein